MSSSGDTFQATATSTAADVAAALTKRYTMASGFSELGGAVAGSVFGGLATLLVGELLDSVFKQARPDFFDYLRSFEKLVGQEIQSDTLDKINGAFNEIVQQIKVQYQPLRTDSVPLSDELKNETLRGLLKEFAATLTANGSEGALGTLQTPRYQVIGFPAFLFGATLHLAILQELASIYDHNEKYKELYEAAVKPLEGSIALQAQTYYDAAMETWQLVKKARRDQIKTPIVSRPSQASVVLTWIERLEIHDGDKIIASWARTNQGMLDEANRYIRDYYWPGTLDALANSLNSPIAIVEAWQSLVACPTGTPTGAWPPNPEALRLPRTRYALVGADNALLNPGDMLLSKDDKHRLVYQHDGNLVLVDSQGTSLWSSGTAGAAGVARMQDDGDFVVYDANSRPVFATHTQGHRDAYAMITYSGKFQIRSSSEPDVIYWPE